ncbi:MAG: MBOAT family protein [Ruminococcus sp.]|nr:MBOAT family protein [Ruminococcus sp.]
MVFSSLVFLFAFLPAVLLLYFVVPKRLKNLTLFVVSLVFYAWGEPLYVLLMIGSILIAYMTGLFADKSKNKPIVAKAAVILDVVWSIGLLFLFKYADFIIENINSLFSTNISLLNYSLPIGISFYTFQSLSYVIDVYRGNVKSQKNFITLGTYVALFPQLVAGPIVRYADIEKQLENRSSFSLSDYFVYLSRRKKGECDKPQFNYNQFASGIKRFSVGLAKKAILANSIYELFNTISTSDYSQLSVAASWLGVIAYTFEIYFDFSGYSDMAIGLGKMLGFDFLENFNYPYISTSITDFWRRWHMSLSSWFRDYVYIPLGGNRKGKARQCLNIMIVWSLTGLWHGASWNFVLWGVYFGVLLMIEKFLLKKPLEKLPNVITHIYALFFIVIGWGIFAYEDTSSLVGNFKNMFGFGGLPLWNGQTTMWFVEYLPIIIILILGSTPLAKSIGEWIEGKNTSLYQCVLEPLSTAAMLLLSAAYLASSSYNPFIYFRF